MSLLLGIAGLGALGYSVASGIYDRYKQNKNNTKSENFSREQLDESIRQYNNDYAEAVRQYNKNFAFNQSEALRSQQNFESEVARDQYNLENQYQIAVADASKAGLNPLALSGFGSSAFGSATSMSAPSSTVSASPSVSGSYSPQKVGSNYSLDMSLISDILDKKFQSSENEKDRQTSKEIAIMQEKTKQDESMLNYLASSESNSISRLRVNNEKELADRKLEIEREANLLLNDRELRKVVNDTKRVGIEEFNSVQKVIQDNLSLQLQVNRLNFEYIRLQTETDRANKDRRERYINSELDRISKHIDTLIHADADITKSVLSMMIFKGK